MTAIRPSAGLRRNYFSEESERRSLAHKRRRMLRFRRCGLFMAFQSWVESIMVGWAE